MKNLILILSILISGFGYSQTFVNTGNIAIPDNNATGISQPINVSGLPNLNCSLPFGIQSICLGITHPFTADLDIELVSPAGTVVEISTDNGAGGDHYGNGAANDAGPFTCFSMSAGTNITTGTAPFAGSFVPEGNLQNFNNGQNPNGNWILRVRDDANGDVGTLFYWSITFNTTGIPCPPPVPSNDLCANATNLPCGTTNLAGTTLGSTNIAHATGCGISNFGVWYSFVGDGQTTTVSSTAAGFNHEMVILQGASCGALTTIACVDVTSSTTGVESYPFSTVNGSTYYVYIGHTTSGGSTTGNFTISRTCNTPTIADCSGATQICNDQTFSGNSGGFGTIQELNNLNRGCLNGNEHQSSWYYWVPSANGTISMTTQTSVDYDFAIWQGTNCANLGSPIRCSFAATTGNTGLGNGATDNSEGVFGNGWVAPLNVSAGIFYIMVIDNFDSDNTPFTIDFTFSTPDLLNCTPTPLPISLYSFSGENVENENVLNWLTLSEVNNDKFIIEHSFDLKSWNILGEVKGSGYGNMYEFEHLNYRYVLNYYRLSQVDFDGSKTVFEPIVIDNTSNKKIVRVFNILGQEVDIDSGGLRIILYDDGTVLKLF